MDTETVHNVKLGNLGSQRLFGFIIHSGCSPRPTLLRPIRRLVALFWFARAGPGAAHRLALLGPAHHIAVRVVRQQRDRVRSELEAQPERR